MVITLISVLVAVVVGGIEALSLLATQRNLHGAFWDTIARASDNFSFLGFLVVGIFAASWAVSTVIYRWRQYDDFDVAVAPPA
jgi:high-affinity nickel-transport protein